MDSLNNKEEFEDVYGFRAFKASGLNDEQVEDLGFGDLLGVFEFRVFGFAVRV